jgi:hypothetical protein
VTQLMDWPLPGLFVLAGAGLVVLLVAGLVVAARRERERQARIRRWAAHYGWQVAKSPVVGWTKQLPGQNQRGVSLLLSGRMHDWHVAVAEYSYTTTSTDSSGSTTTTTHRYLVTAVRLTASYPPLAVQPRGALSRLGRAMFGDNAAATGHDPFDRHFRVRTKDPVYARTLVGPALIAEHLAGRIPEWSLAGYDLLTWQSGELGDPRHIPSLVAPLVRVAVLLGR